MGQIEIEKEFHNKFFNSSEFYDFIDVEKVRKYWLQPCYKTGKDHYSDNKMEFHKIIKNIINISNFNQ